MHNPTTVVPVPYTCPPELEPETICNRARLSLPTPRQTKLCTRRFWCTRYPEYHGIPPPVLPFIPGVSWVDSRDDQRCGRSIICKRSLGGAVTIVPGELVMDGISIGCSRARIWLQGAQRCSLMFGSGRLFRPPTILE